jgi:hypothetical protein
MVLCIRGSSGFSGGKTEKMGKTGTGKAEFDEIHDPAKAYFPAISHVLLRGLPPGAFIA